MTAPLTASRTASMVAYGLSAVTTLFWVGSVLPAGPVASAATDAATPFHREGLLLVPAALLLVLLPVGCTLTRRFRGGLALLAATDAFIALYAAIAIWYAPHRDRSTGVFCAILIGIGVLSVMQAIRSTRAQRRPESRWLQGSRLALCLLVLMVPARWLMQSDVERASFLAPFLVVAVSAAGAHLANTTIALRLTSALIQLAFAVHLLLTMRLTLFDHAPTITSLSIFGRVTWGLSIAVVAFALLQVGVLLHERRKGLVGAPRSGIAGAGAG